MGGEGNLATLRQALRDELTGRGYEMPAQDPAWYASVEEFTRLYRIAGFERGPGRADRAADAAAGRDRRLGEDLPRRA